MNKGLSFCIIPAALSVLACSANTSLPEQSEASTLEREVVQSTAQALTVDSSCSPETAERIRRIQTDITDLVWKAASDYENDPWSQWALYSFNQPNYGQYQQVLDDLWIVTLTLDADRGLGGGIHYDCRPQGSEDCKGTAWASAEDGSDPWLVHICDNWHALENAGGPEYGYAMQRSAILHEYFHFLGYRDQDYCNCAIEKVWEDPLWSRSPDNYQLFINGVNGVPSACEIYQNGESCDD
jgi:hypothetical protein